MAVYQYHPFNRFQASCWSGGCDPSSVCTSAPASSAHRLLSPFKLAAIARPNLQIRDWYFVGSWRAETLFLTSLHVDSEIHAFLLASCDWGFGTALRRAAKIPSSFIEAVGGRRGSRLPPRGIWHVPSGGCCEGIPEPCSGLNYAWGPGWIHSRRYGDPSP